MNNQHLPQRCCLFILGLFSMTLGIALSCKADLGTTPISSVPWIISMFTPWSIGQLTIAMSLLFVVVQPLLLRALYWRELLGQIISLLALGYGIDFSMYLLSWVQPESLLLKWTACILSTAILGFGTFLCIRAKIFVSSGEGIVLVLAFVTKLKFSLIKNFFDISLVTLSFAISMLEFGQMKGIGLGTVAAAILVGRFIHLYTNHLHIFDKWLVNE